MENFDLEMESLKVCEDIDILTDTIRIKFNDKPINFSKLKLKRRAEILEKIRAGIEKKYNLAAG